MGYNFGELLEHPVISVLQETQYAWLAHLLRAFNAGDIAQYEVLVAAHHQQLEAQPALLLNTNFLKVGLTRRSWPTPPCLPPPQHMCRSRAGEDHAHVLDRDAVPAHRRLGRVFAHVRTLCLVLHSRISYALSAVLPVGAMQAPPPTAA